jgi:hypothetical protein
MRLKIDAGAVPAAVLWGAAEIPWVKAGNARQRWAETSALFADYRYFGGAGDGAWRSANAAK